MLRGRAGQRGLNCIAIMFKRSREGLHCARTAGLGLAQPHLEALAGLGWPILMDDAVVAHAW